MKTTWDTFREDVLKAVEAGLKKAKIKLKHDEMANTIEEPPSYKMGDLACSVSFPLGKKLKKSPREIAELLIEKIPKPKNVSEIKLAGAYVNFFFKKDIFSKSVISEALKENYGKDTKLKEKVMVEYSNPNPYKAFHIGHIRGTSLGESLSRILKFYGYDVIQANYFNDMGAHVAKCLWAYLRFYKNETPPANKGEWLGKIYSEASKKIEENAEYGKEVGEVLKKLESETDSELIKTWKETRQWSIDEFHNIYKELDANFDVEFYESTLEKRGKEIVKELTKKKIAKKSAGALVVELKKYELPTFMLLKSDGTSLYSTKDLALAEEKFRKYKIDHSVYVVGSEQRLYFQQLFKVLELMGFKQAKKCFHLTFDLVTLKEGKMSSREGTAILYSELRDKMFQKALSEVVSRHPEFDASLQRKIAMEIAIGAMKFSMLNISNSKTIFFEWEKALEFEGETGPYIQYACVRAKRIIEKGKAKNVKLSKIKFKLLKTDDEYILSKHLAKFPLVIREAAENYKPYLLANYAYALAEKFSLFYNNQHVLNATDQELKEARLALVNASYQVLKTSLALLGIKVPERM